MSEGTIRVGRVSKVNYDTGMVRGTYPDMDDAVSAELSFLTSGDEYKMPKVGDNVLVSHLGSGQSRGVVLGTYWNKQHNSQKTGQGVFRKELAETPGEAYFDYDPASKTLTINAERVVINGLVGQG